MEGKVETIYPYYVYCNRGRFIYKARTIEKPLDDNGISFSKNMLFEEPKFVAIGGEHNNHDIWGAIKAWNNGWNYLGVKMGPIFMMRPQTLWIMPNIFIGISPLLCRHSKRGATRIPMLENGSNNSTRKFSTSDGKDIDDDIENPHGIKHAF